MRALSQQGDPLEQLAQVVPWEAFDWPWPKSFDTICKFKVFVLQVLYNLSNDQTEYQIRDRLSFMRFLVLDPAQYIPDAQTIWLFRETLAQADVVEALF